VIVWRYENTTIAIKATIVIVIGSEKERAPLPAKIKTPRAASVA